jgi:Ca2+-transporting ATPase
VSYQNPVTDDVLLIIYYRWKIFLAQFNDLLVIMLMVASVVAGVLGQVPACVVILVIVFANAILGTLMEVRAGEELAKLQNDNIPNCEVIRDGRLQEVPIPTLVPGDIYIMNLGDKIAADCRLIETNGMQLNEACLTGEADIVKKDSKFCEHGKDAQDRLDAIAAAKADAAPKEHKEEELTELNMAYKETDVAMGRGRGLVVKTGMNSKMGQIFALINDADESMSPLQAKLTVLGQKLGFASLFVSIIVFVIGVTTGNGANPNTPKDEVWLEMLLVAVSLTVAAVPEGLPACVTICLANGMKTMSAKKAEIRNLHSVETLGSASVICTDKTGTLTAGKMTAVRLFFGGALFAISGTGYQVEGTITESEETDSDLVALVAAKDEEAGISAAAQTDAHYFPFAIGVLCSNASVAFDDEAQKWVAKGNNSERPLVVAAYKAGMKKDELDGRFERVHENTFSSSRKMMSVVIKSSGQEEKAPFTPLGGEGNFISCVKGAPNMVLAQCTHIVAANGSGAVRKLGAEEQALILEQIDAMSSKTYRVLAFAYKTLDNAEEKSVAPECCEQGLTFAGFVASVDPHRPEVIPAIDKCYSAGIRVVMITGDYVKTAKAIAEAIHLLPKGSDVSKAIDCKIVREIGLQIEGLKDDLEAATASKNKNEIGRINQEIANVRAKLDAITAHADVYARAKPVDKITIVESFQRQGLIASMTGDGVNDAPALKQANIGVAMGITGSDVAKNAADMVLKDDNFASIVDAVEEGRAIYANIGKFVFFLLSTNVAEVFLILTTSIIGLQTPLVPMQILWLNLATDGMPAIALAVEPIEPGVMNEGPRLQSEALIEKLMMTGIVIQTVVLTLILLFSYMFGMHYHGCGWMGIQNPDWTAEFNQMEIDVFDLGIKKAQTMAILIITFAELLRAYSSRSLRASVFSLGFFSNKYMQYAVGASVVSTIVIAVVPPIGEPFGIYPLDASMWIYVLLISLVPFILDEVTKYFYRQQGFGARPKVDRSEKGLAAAENKIQNSSDGTSIQLHGI